MLVFSKKYIFYSFYLLLCSKFVLVEAKTLLNTSLPRAEAGGSALMSVRLEPAQKNPQGSLSNKLILKFSNLQGFSSKIMGKPSEKGNQMMLLTFNGISKKDASVEDLMAKVSQVKVPYQEVAQLAFPQFSIYPKPEDAHAGKNHEDALCLLLEFNPQLTKVLVSQAGGQDCVEIEVFNCQQLNKLVAKGFCAEAPRLAANANDSHHLSNAGLVRA